MFRPERRNRKIGTAAAGYKASNKMQIPDFRLDRSGRGTNFIERVKPVSKSSYAFHGKELIFLTEELREGFIYGCNAEDIIYLFEKLGDKIADLPDIIVFRQPTVKQAMLNPVWGRCLFDARIVGLEGSAIILESQEVHSTFHWPRQLSNSERVELDRLANDGHKIEANKRHYFTVFHEPAIRQTILYRTLLHELGHLKHYNICLKSPDNHGEFIDDFYWSIPQEDREVYAHRFADELAIWLRDQ